MCDIKIPLPRDTSAGGSFAEYYLFEPYDGTNVTWGRKQDTGLLAPDASPGLGASFQADVPFIPADEI